jgi:hypothetical protein
MINYPETHLMLEIKRIVDMSGKGWKGGDESYFRLENCVCMVSCFLWVGQISADGGSIEGLSFSKQTYLNATKIDSELPPGFSFELRGRNIDMYNDTSLHYVDSDWGGYNAKHEYLAISIDVSDGYYATSPAELRKQFLEEPGVGWDYLPYNDLPGGVIESSHDELPSWIVIFWKSPYIWGQVQIVGDKKNGQPTFSDDFLRSECERLAKLVYDRLPGESPKHSELISVLKKYRPKLFGSALNPKLTDDTISQALSEHEVGTSGMEGATIALNKNMLSDIDEFLKKLKEPIPSWNKSLITTLEKDNWGNTMNYYYKMLDKAYKYIKFCDDYGYEYDFPVPPPIGPAEWIMKYKDYLDKAEYLRDSYYLPAVSEDMYQRYKQKRSEKLGSDEAFEESIIEGQTTLDKFIPDFFNMKISDYIKGSGWYAVRAAPEFAFMGDDNAAVEKLLLQRFENRYNIEKLKDERDKMVKYPDYYINAIIHDYDSKILLISQTCDRILTGQKTTAKNKE